MCSLSPLCVTPSLHTNMSFYNPPREYMSLSRLNLRSLHSWCSFPHLLSPARLFTQKDLEPA